MQGSVCSETETWTHKHKFLTLLLQRMGWRDPRSKVGTPERLLWDTDAVNLIK